MEQGINVSNESLVQVLQNKLAQAVIREAQMEAAIFQLQGEVQQLKGELDASTDESEQNQVLQDG